MPRRVVQIAKPAWKGEVPQAHDGFDSFCAKTSRHSHIVFDGVFVEDARAWLDAGPFNAETKVGYSEVLEGGEVSLEMGVAGHSSVTGMSANLLLVQIPVGRERTGLRLIRRIF